MARGRRRLGTGKGGVPREAKDRERGEGDRERGKVVREARHQKRGQEVAWGSRRLGTGRGGPGKQETRNREWKGTRDQAPSPAAASGPGKCGKGAPSPLARHRPHAKLPPYQLRVATMLWTRASSPDAVSTAGRRTFGARGSARPADSRGPDLGGRG